MSVSKYRLLCSAMLATSIIPSSPALAQTAAPKSANSPSQSSANPEQATPDGSYDIIVTANKREERALEVPGAITAFRADDLLRSGATSIRDFAGFTPGLQFNNGLGSGAPIIRGLSEGLDTSPTVATIVNGAPIGSSSSLSLGAQDTLDIDPIDMVRVEVLKGPQGTLYGASTLGGLISYTLREPSLTKPEAIVRGEFSATERGDPSYSLRALVGGPIVTDKVGLQVSGYYDRRGGFVDNAKRNLQDENHNESWGLRGGLLLQPVDELKITLDAFYQRLDQPAGDVVAYNFATRQPRDGDLRYDEYVLPSARKKIFAAVANVDYDFGFANLTSVTSLQRINSDNEQNLTNSSTNAIFAGVLPQLGGVPYPVPAITALTRVTSYHKTTQELRLTSPGDRRFSWILGGYYSYENNDYNASFVGRNTTGGDVPTLAPALNVQLLATLKEYSGFANVTFKIVPDLDLTGGIRIGQIDQTYRQLLRGSDAAAYNLLLRVTYGSQIPTASALTPSSESVKTYLATLRYHFSPDGIIFARYSTGFRPGGPNLVGPGLPATFNSDRTRTFEGGLKTRFFGNRGSLDVTGYYTKWEDIIVVIAPGGISGYTSGGDARLYGVEAALNLRPVQGLTLNATFAYAKGNIQRADPSAAGALKQGDELPYNPRTSGSFSAEYRAPAFSNWSGYGSASFRYASSRNSTFESNALLYTMPAYGLFDLHAGLENGRYSVDLFVKNLTNKRAQLATNSFYGLGEVTVQRPRTIGLSVTGRY